MGNRVIAAQANASAQLFASATGYKYRLRGVYFVGAATAGTLVFKDGGSSGAVLLTINTPPITTSGTTSSGYIQIPGDGILFDTDIYCTVTTAAFVTAFAEQVR